MNPPSKIIPKTFDAYASEYEDKFNKNPLGQYQRQRVQAEISAYLKPGVRFLDAGCGPGSDFAFYQQLDITADAIDISPEMVSIAQKNAEKLKLKANIQCVSLENFRPEKKYDVILLNFGVINAIGDLPFTMEKLRQVLAENGILFIVSMPPFHAFSFLENIFRLKWKTAFRRVFKQKAILANNFEIFYYRAVNFKSSFHLIKRINLCALLPTPDQYARFTIARKIAHVFKKADQKLAGKTPDWLGGDHVCYLLKKAK